MKTIFISLASFLIGMMVPINTVTTTTVNTEQDISVELSVGGEVKVLKAPANSSIHIIADDNMYLTDVQVLPHSKPLVLATSDKTQKHGKPANTTTAAISP